MTSNTATIRLGAIGYQLGVSRPLAELATLASEAGAPMGALAKVQANAEFACYRRAAPADPYALACAAVERTLAVSPLEPGEIDMVIFATDSFRSVRQTMLFYQAFSARFGLHCAYPLLVTMSECANFHSALEVAWQATLSGRARNVLLVTVDLADVVSPETRIVGDGIGVMSDAAASCLVSARLDEGLRLRALERRIKPELTGATLDPQQELLLRLDVNNQLFERLLADGGPRAGAVRQVLPSNLSLPFLATFLGEAGFAPEQIYSANHRGNAHCLASDCLINLHDHVAADGADPGDQFVLYGLGPVSWGGALLQAEHTLDAL